jgi:flagellar motor switch protein FliN/FliY
MPEINQTTDGPVKNLETLDLLLDVELPVSVSFGKTQAPLQQVLKWTTGSIVELECMVNEPVEVVVNNCVIARGEVVVVDGNYGVRVHEIVSRAKRLETSIGTPKEGQEL